MKVIDKNGRLFGKVSIIEVVVVLLVIVLAVALRHKAQLPQTGTTVAETPITIQVWARNLRPEIVDSIHIGDGLYDPDRTTGGAIGRVTDIQVSEGTGSGGADERRDRPAALRGPGGSDHYPGGEGPCGERALSAQPGV